MKNALDWLLEEENPAIRYRTMTEIQHIPPEECRAAYDAIWRQKTIARLLQRQDEHGLWGDADYGAHTSLRYLTAFAEHGLRRDERLDRFAESAIRQLKTDEAQGDLAGCTAPLTLRALVMLGYDVLPLVDTFVAAQLRDGGFMCKMKLEKKPQRKSCYKAAVTALLLYAECKRHGCLPQNTDALAEYFLKRDIFYTADKTRPLYEGIRPGWRAIDNFFPAEPMRVGLPLIAHALAALGLGDHPAMAETWRLLAEKQNENGRLCLEGTLAKQPCSFGKVGAENKWLTFYAASALLLRDS